MYATILTCFFISYFLPIGPKACLNQPIYIEFFKISTSTKDPASKDDNHFIFECSNVQSFNHLFVLVQVHHTFATAGSDGSFNFWDKDSKQRLKVSPCKLFVILIYNHSFEFSRIL